MTALRALVVDDEPNARAFLRKALERNGGVTVLDECGDGPAALARIEALELDVVFLDVQMPGLTGVEVAASLARDRPPHVVFITAYDDHAVRAFELSAVDYLLKPFDQPRLDEAVTRVQQRLATGHERGGNVEALLQRLDELGQPLERLAVGHGRETVVLQLTQVDWIESEGNYVRLHHGLHAYLLRTTLAAIEDRLDARRFVRIHRTTIVNIDRIERLRSLGHGDFAVTLGDGTELRLSRRYRERFERRIPRPG